MGEQERMAFSSRVHRRSTSPRTRWLLRTRHARTGVRVRGDILPAIKKRLVKTSPRFPLSFEGEAGAQAMFWSFYIITSCPCRSFVRNKTLPRSTPSVHHETFLPSTNLSLSCSFGSCYTCHLRETSTHHTHWSGTKLTRTYTRVHLLLSNSRVMTRLTYKWKSGL